MISYDTAQHYAQYLSGDEGEELQEYIREQYEILNRIKEMLFEDATQPLGNIRYLFQKKENEQK